MLKSRIAALVHNSFKKRDGSTRYTHIEVGQRKGCLANYVSGGGGKHVHGRFNMQNSMPDFLVDYVFPKSISSDYSSRAIFWLTHFPYSYENYFSDSLARSGHRRLARSFNLCYRYIDDLIVFNNKRFIDYAKDVHTYELNAEKANRLDDPPNYLDLTFILGDKNRLYN